MTHDVETIMRTWRRMGPLLRKSLKEGRCDRIYVSPIQIMAAGVVGPTDHIPEPVRSIGFKRVVRGGIEIIEGDGVMVDLW